MEKTLQEQLTEVETLLEQEKGKGVQKDVDVITHLEDQQAVILKQMDEAKAKEEQAAAEKVVIHEATVKAEYWLDNLEVEGLTMSQLSASDDAYKLMRVGVQRKLVEMEQQSSNDQRVQEIEKKELQRQIEELQQSLKESESKCVTFTQIKAERDDFEGKLKNATDEIDRLNTHIDDLRKEISVGAREAYKVIDQTDQIKELADKIKASRIHVYDVVPDVDFNPKNFTAKRVDTGESVTYNWTQARLYVELKDAAEVERFRAEHAEKSIVPDPALDHAHEVKAVAEVAAPDLPFQVDPGTVHQEVQMAVGNSSAPVAGTTVTREEVNIIHARLERLEKQANLPYQVAV